VTIFKTGFSIRPVDNVYYVTVELRVILALHEEENSSRDYPDPLL
jgi:hypothetical protein